MDRQGFNNYQRGGGHPRNGYHGYYSRGHHHGAAPRHGRPNMHQQNHQSRHHAPPSQQPPSPQQTPPQAPQQGQQYSPYSYYAPVATVMTPPQMPRGNMTSQYTLSPNAQEFVPSTFMTMRDPSLKFAYVCDMAPQPLIYQPMPPQQTPHRHIQADAAGSHATEPYEDPYQYYSKSYDEEDDAILQLQMFITDVTLSPELYVPKANDIIPVVFEDICIRKNPPSPVVAIIFQAGVLQQNFRYSGARLCELASNMVTTLDGEALFRDCLIDHMYESLSKVKPVVGDKETDKESRGTALFCAELFFQLDLGYKLDISDSYPDMGVILCRTIKQLILCNEKENQKSGIQALKLCGANLEKLCEKTDAMDDLLQQCKDLEAQEGIDSTIQFMLARLPQLREANWNRVDKKTLAPPCMDGPDDYDQMPVMYGPDGQPISEEELGFLTGTNQVATGPAGPAGMDDEAHEAYEQFLQETGQK